MLKDWMPRPAGEQNEQKARLKRSREELAALQMKLKENKLPVLVLVEGWGAAGKGSLIRSLIKELDPRFFQVVNMGRPTPEEQRYPFLKRYVQTIPEEGKIVFLDSGWMDEVVRQRQQKTIDSGEYELRLQSTEVFERQLVADGYLLVKLFLHIDRATQKKRLEALAADEDTAWRVSENDRWQQKHYGWALDCFDEYLEATDTAWATWKILNGGDEGGARAESGGSICAAASVAALASALGEGMMPDAHWPAAHAAPEPDSAGREPAGGVPPSPEGMPEKLARLHKPAVPQKGSVVIHTKAGMQQERAATSSLPVRWTPAATGGAHCQPHPAGKEPPLPVALLDPAAQDRAHCHFDRSWYGRVMVERLEGFCTEADWKRAYNEINEFERELTQWGAVVVKFWVQIDRIPSWPVSTTGRIPPKSNGKSRMRTGATEKKWDAYEQAVDDAAKPARPTPLAHH